MQPLLPSAHDDSWPRQQLPPIEQWPVLNLVPPYDYPATLNAAAELLDAAIADGFGEQIAVIARGEDGRYQETTYKELGALVDSIAHVLREDLSLVPGNRVLLRGYNGLWMAAAWLATVKMGCVAVTTMPLLRAKELRTIIERAQCAAALCDVRLADELLQAARSSLAACTVRVWGSNAPDSLDVLRSTHAEPFAAHATSRDDVCLIAFTSGTTGDPKGCMHFHRDVMVMCDGFSRQVLATAHTDRCIGTPPLAFTFGLGGLLCFPLASRATAVLLERCTPESLLEAVAATRATVSFTAPTFYRQMALVMQREPARYNTSSLRACVSAGEALPDATRVLWRTETGVELLDGIGATELIHIFVAAANEHVRAGAIGRAVPGFEIAILDDALMPLPAGIVGRLAVRGPTGCRYLNDPRQRDYVRGGWNLTGDAASMDDDGYVFFKARTDDLIISAGHNIGAPEVESALLTHPEVMECAVIGVPDEDRGHAVKAFVVLRTGVSASPELAKALQDHVKATIAPYKYPRVVEFVSSLPKTDTGKLQRFRLKEVQ